MHTKSTPFPAELRCPGHHRSKPGAHNGFLFEGPIGPRLPPLLVPTSWDAATLEPTHAQPFCSLDSPQSITSPSAPAGSWEVLRPLVSRLPHLPHTRCPFPFSQEGVPAVIQQWLHRSPSVGLALPEGSCASSCF